MVLLVCLVGMAVRWAAGDRVSFAIEELLSHAPHLTLESYSATWQTSSF